MKRTLFVLAICLISSSLSAQTQAKAIVGEWLNEDKDAKVTIYEQGDKFYGKVSWLKEPNDDNGKPRVDEENPDASLRKRPISGLVLLKNFSFQEGEWKSGTIYDPKNGKTYDCYMELLAPNKLKIRGYVMGMRALGRTTYWTR